MYKNEPPRPRLCHLHRRRDFDGYGFNLHCDRNKPGQFIGKVDPNSPAESAGLKENDRIFEVNFVLIGSENHKQVVARIKEGVSRNNTKYPDEVILLVADQETQDYYRSQSKTIDSSDPNVEKLETDMRDYLDNASNSSRSSNHSNDREYSSQEKPNHSNQEEYLASNNKNYISPSISRTSEQNSDDGEDDYERTHPSQSLPYQRQESPNITYKIVNSSTKSPETPTHTNVNSSTKSPEKPTSPSNQTDTTLNFHMSAAEYREQLARNPRKRDPRINQRMTMKQKYDAINNM